MRHRFPEDFVWGAATSAYQIEGSPLADGAGPSIWQRYAHTPGRMHDDDHGDVACDHYRRWPQDIALMRALGLTSYRFSVSWSRVLPDGTGRINQAGLDFYSRLVDGLLDAGIVPNLTMFHWDMPAALDDRGGWLNRDSADWFADYARVLLRALGDRVPLWSTINEPWVISDGGYLHGTIAPGHRNLYEAPIVAHHLLRAHGAAVQAARAEASQASIGLVVNIEPKYPHSDDPADLAATRRAHAYMNRQFLDPALLGRYPEELAEVFGDAWPDRTAADLALIQQPLDFVGINYYTRAVIRHADGAPPLHLAQVPQRHATCSDTGWEVYPAGLADALTWFTRRYGALPVYVTENGAAFYDPPVAAGDTLDDPLRTDYLRAHLRALCDAIDAGVPLKGYYAWSLLDNLEWSLGYAKRFGLCHVDFQTQRRTPKRSARFYAEVIASHGAALDD